MTARANPTADESAAGVTQQHIVRLRSLVMRGAGAASRPGLQRVGIRPEALAPSAIWSVTGRKAVRTALKRHRPDVVWATSPPIAAHLVVAGLAKEIKVPVVAELRDNWAGNPFYDAGGTVLQRIEGRALRDSDAIVVVTPAMVDRMRALHPDLAGRVHLLENGYDQRITLEARPRRDTRQGDVRLIHAGPIHGYPGRTLEPLLAGMRRAGDRYVLELVGAGVQVKRTEVRIVASPRAPWQDAIRAQANADIGVVLHSSDRTALGTKVFELLALRVPVLALVDKGNALDELLRGLGQGSGCAQHDDPDDIALALERLALDPPPAPSSQALARWDRAAVTARAAALLAQVTGRDGALANAPP